MFRAYFHIGTIPWHIEHYEAYWRLLEAELEQKGVKCRNSLHVATFEPPHCDVRPICNQVQLIHAIAQGTYLRNTLGFRKRGSVLI